MIKSENLKFQYKRENQETIALDGLNIEIPKGEFTVIIGHNGSGKSTFAKLANGILLPSGGSIFVGGMDTKDHEKIWEIRKTAGMVFQNPDNQIVATIVEEDVAFGPENLGIHQMVSESAWMKPSMQLACMNIEESHRIYYQVAKNSVLPLQGYSQ